MGNNETIHERISQLVDAFGEGKNTVFASIIGSNEANVRGYKATVMPKFDFLEKIARNLDVDLKWLLTGEGSMHGVDNTQLAVSHASETTSLILSSNDESNFISVPLVEISVAAGCGGYENPNYIEIENEIKLPSTMLRHNAKYYCIRVKGDSMAPTILDSSYLIVRLLERSEWVDIRDQHVYVVSDRDGRAYLKRLKNRFCEHGFITCMSDNPDKVSYSNFNLLEEEINSILYAEFCISAKMPNIHETYYKKVGKLEDDMDILKAQMSQVMKNINMIK